MGVIHIYIYIYIYIYFFFINLHTYLRRETEVFRAYRRDLMKTAKRFHRVLCGFMGMVYWLLSLVLSGVIGALSGFAGLLILFYEALLYTGCRALRGIYRVFCL